MTALTIDIDDRLIVALRETAARRHTTIDAVVGSAVSEIVGHEEARESFRELAMEAPLNFEPGQTWSREESHARPLLR